MATSIDPGNRQPRFPNIFLLVFLLFPPFLLTGQVLYPGDTNNDGICNHIDLLPIGIAYNTEGIPREGATTDWVPQFYEPWPSNLPLTGVNNAFQDTDGNGFIDSPDIDAIAIKSQSRRQAITQNERQTCQP